MRIALLQTDIVWKQPQANRNRLEELLANLSQQADIAIFPEMFTTGFCMQPKEVAEEGEETLSWMQSLSRKYRLALGGSVAIKENSNYYNRFYFVKPDGEYSIYNKRHLFTFGGEDKEYSSGNERVITEYKGVRILLQICYDLRFPVYARNRGDYDMLIYVANWPTVRQYAWDTLVRARAIENLSYVVAVNRAGADPTNTYTGGSVLLDFMGKPIVESGVGEGTAFGSIDLNALNEFRQKFPALKDADNFEL